jgi:hypothetical protein
MIAQESPTGAKGHCSQFFSIAPRARIHMPHLQHSINLSDILPACSSKVAFFIGYGRSAARA